MCFFVLLKSARTQKILQIGKVGLGASAAVRRRDLTREEKGKRERNAQ